MNFAAEFYVQMSYIPWMFLYACKVGCGLLKGANCSQMSEFKEAF